MSKSKIFLLICLSFILGVYLGPVFSNIYAFFIASIAITVGSLGKTKLMRLVALGILSLVVGMFCYDTQSKESNLVKIYGQKIEMRVLVVEEPDVRSDKVMLTVQNGQKEKLLLTVSRYPEYEYGDLFLMSGKIREPADAKTPGEFSYKNYLSRFGINAVVYYPKISQVEHGKANGIKSAIFKIKHKFSKSLDKVLNEPENGFLKGILIGEKRTISDAILAQFQITGTTHLIAISGFNITIIAQSLSRLFDRFGRRISFVISLFSIFAFVILTGASASVVRAGIMAAIGLIALNLGRVYVITNALVLTAVIMLVQNPKILRFDLGFQLSFLALMGIVYLAPVFETWWRAPKFIKNYLFPTVAAQIFTLPLILYNFGQMSFVAPLTNLVILPWIPAAMLAGFVTGVAGIINSDLAAPIAWVSWLILFAILKIVEWTSKLPLASVKIEAVPLAVPVTSYVLITLIFIYLQIWKPKQNA